MNLLSNSVYQSPLQNLKWAKTKGNKNGMQVLAKAMPQKRSRCKTSPSCFVLFNFLCMDICINKL